MKANFLQWFNPVRWYQRLTHLTTGEWKSLGLKVSALVLASILYLIARQPFIEVRVVGVPVEFSGLREGVELMSDTTPQTVNLRLRGRRDQVRGLMPNQMSVMANLANKEPGERVVQLRLRDVVAPEGVEVLQIEPASIKLRLEPVGKKLVNVEPSIIGNLDEGVELYRITATPNALEVTGPQSHLDALKQLKTESVSLKGHRESFEATVDVELPQPSLRVANRASVTLSLEIGERRISRLFTNLPVQWVGPMGNVRLLTKTVEVVLLGPRAEIEAMRPDDLKVELTLHDLPANADAAIPHVRLPNRLAQQIEIKSINPTEVRVKR
jgi:YbbR domain-containing protein